MALEGIFNAYDAIKSYHWLDHQKLGYTELLAIHPDYKAGKENYEHNLKNKTFPKVWYAKNEKQVLAFLSKYHGSYMCCYGVNPRPELFKGDKGYPRRAKDSDIKVIKNYYLDFDFINGVEDKPQIKMMEEFLEEVDNYVSERASQRPVHAFSGNGCHLLFALPGVDVQKHSDIGDRVYTFFREIQDKFASDMERYGIKLDNTTDLSRVAKIYGTRKPGSERISRFCFSERAEDESLLEYLLSLPVVSREPKKEANMQVTMYDSLPTSFSEMLEKDTKLASLWNGTGKDSGDTSRSGYDMSLMHAAIKQGIKDVKALSTILALRPDGAVRGSGKGDEYIRVTVMKALENSKW